ncbi:MAG TPA: CRISPR-associated helicase Cas3' [Thermotogota bacterium]|nr:CRISPR-associated helicase Cas3' [Thermotogota bacterium]
MNQKYDETKDIIAHIRKRDKKEQLLTNHLNNTSQIAESFCTKFGMGSFGKVAGLLHDIGKATEEFQEYLRDMNSLVDSDEDDYITSTNKKGKIDHSTAGAQYVYDYLSKNPLGDPNTNSIISQIVSLIIASHHSGLIDCITPEGENAYIRRIQKEEKLTRIEEALVTINPEIMKKAEDVLSQGLILSEFKKICLSIKEEEDDFSTYAFKSGLLVKLLFSCLIDADRLDTSDFEFPESLIVRNHGKYISWSLLIEAFERYINFLPLNTEIDRIRKIISESCREFAEGNGRGLYYLTVPTGGGKTLSSLRFALHHVKKHEMDRIFYIIPYTSIIDQNADVVRSIFKHYLKGAEDIDRIVLEHHSNLTPEEETTPQRLLSENWDAPIVFTTMVQFLESIFGSGTRSIRRFHQLTNSVIIFDEIQTLPVKCVHLFNMVARFLVKAAKSTVILCTATQPLLSQTGNEHRSLRIPEENNIVKGTTELNERLKRVEIIDSQISGGWELADISNLVCKLAGEEKSVLIIVNTKKEAKELFLMLEPFLSKTNIPLYHLSTNMCPAHRLNVLNGIRSLLNENKQVICVSTQLIEAGVDVDFNTVVRYIAPMESIVQAAGRCNRNGRQEIGYVYVINPKNESLGQLREIESGKEVSERLFREFKENPIDFDKDLLSLKTINAYYQYYFHSRDRQVQMDYPINKGKGSNHNDNLFNLLSYNTLSLGAYKRKYTSMPNIYFRQSFRTAANSFSAIDTASRGVLVPYESGEEIIRQLASARDYLSQLQGLKKARRYSVNLFLPHFSKAADNKLIYDIIDKAGIYALKKQFYSEKFGFSEEAVGLMDFLLI